MKHLMFLINDHKTAIGAAAVANYFGWKRLAVIYTLNTFGTDAFELFKISAAQYNIDIISSFSVTPGVEADNESKSRLRYSLHKMKDLDSLIFVFLMDDIVAAKDVWMTAYELKVISFDTITIGTHDITNPEIWKDADVAQSVEWRGILAGW